MKKAARLKVTMAAAFVFAFLLGGVLIVQRLAGAGAFEGLTTDRREAGTASFVLPANLEVIEEEAFAGTAAETVVLPETAVEVQDQAFAEMPFLTAVTIPAGVQTLGDDLFAGNANVTVIGVAGSTAQRWAAAHGYAFAEPAARLPGIGVALQLARFAKRLVTLFLLAAFGLLLAAEGRKKPACRRIGAIRAMRRRERAEIHIQDGYFP